MKWYLLFGKRIGSFRFDSPLQRLAEGRHSGFARPSSIFRAVALSTSLAFGTAANATDVSGTISENTTWTLAGSPYIVTGWLQISSGITLTIEPGVIVKLTGPGNPQGIVVSGTLIADGTGLNKIVFTSICDDSYGGDTNGDGSATTPLGSDWSYIRLSASSIIDNCVIRYGGNGGGDMAGNLIVVDGGSPQITNSEIQYSCQWGIICSYICNPDIRDNIIEKGIRCTSGANPTIIGNTLANQILVESGDPIIQNNAISTGDAYPIDLRSNVLTHPITGNNLNGTNKKGVLINGTYSSNGTLLFNQIDLPYVTNGWLGISTGVTLTIEPGVIVKLTGPGNPQGIVVSGTLIADGTGSNKIVFTSICDDSYGGDTNGDGSATTPLGSDWSYIRLSASSIIDNCVIRYGGNGGGDMAGNLIVVDGGSPQITNSKIEYSWQSAIICTAGSIPLIQNNLISHSSFGVYCSSNSDPIIYNNSIIENSSYGVYNSSTAIIISARQNWWGDPTGPYHVTQNPEGLGNAVSDYVDFSNWLTSEPTQGDNNSMVFLYSPQYNQTITTNEVTFRWSNAGAQYYELYVDDDSDFNSAEISKYQISALNNYTGTEYTICGNWMAAGTQYWKVKAIFAGGGSIESVVSHFTYSPPITDSPNWQPLYRLYHSGDKDHFYCSSPSHAEIAIGSGYKYERSEGYVSTQRFTATDLVSIFRFYDGAKKCHYYTVDESDRDAQISNGLIYEGITGFAYANSHGGLAPLYHLKKEFSSSNHDHFYTLSEVEKANAINAYSFSLQGITAYLSLTGGESTVPVYSAQVQVGSGINTQNGNFRHYTKTSFNISSIGLPLVFEHIYNSKNVQLPAQIIPLGPGWSHSYNACIVSYPDSLAVFWPDGSIHTYSKDTYECGTTGVYDWLSSVGSGHYEIKKKDQTIYTFERPTAVGEEYPAMLVSIKDRNGNTVSLTYETSGLRRLTTVSCPAGRHLNISYYEPDSSAHLIKQVSDPISRTIQFEYDRHGNLSKFTDAEGQVTEYNYDTNYPQDHELVSIKLPKGNIIDNSYEERKITSQKYHNLTNGLTLNYEADKTTLTDEMSRTFEISKYGSGFPKEIKCTSLNTGSIYFTRDADHPDLATAIKDQKDQTTSYVYDARGNVLEVHQPGGIGHYYVYDSMNNLTKYTDPRGKETNYTYNAKGNLTNISDPLSHSTGFSPLSNGLIASMTNPMSHTTSFGYDANGNLNSVQDPLLHSTSYLYDNASRMTQMNNAKSQITRYSYTANDRIETVTDAANGITRYDYDDNDNLTTITDPKSQATTWGYDFDWDLLNSISNPLGNQTSYSYNDDGSLATKSLPSGSSIGYTYDGAGRLNLINYPSATVMFGYDNNGNITSVADSNGTMSFTYDALNRLTSHTDYYGNTVGYGYDATSNLTSITYPGSKTVSYVYYDDNRLHTVTDWNSHVTSYTYRSDGSLQDVSYPNDTRCTYSYDNADRLTGISNTRSDGSVIAGYSYTLDEIGNHTSENCTEPYNVPSLNAQNISLTYNAANRLQTAGSTSYSFGANGTLSSKSDGYSYTWDTENRLIRVSSAQTASYSYDAFGNRRSATRNGNTVRYVLDIHGPMSQVLMETDGSNNPTAYYVYGIGLIARVKPNGTMHYYHYNNVGSTMAMTDQSQNITHKYAYDPFGGVTDSEEADANPFLFVGQYGVMDEGNGLHFMRARYYEAETGRFVSEDPVGFNSGDLNLYAYASNRPLTSMDLTGEKQDLLNRIKKSTVSTVVKKVAEKAVEKLGAKVLGAGMRTVGTTLVRASVYGPFAYDVGADIYRNRTTRENRDWSDRLARACIDITMSATFGIANLATGGWGGTAAGVLYDAQREEIQNSIIYNPIANAAGGFLYEVFWPKPAQ